MRGLYSHSREYRKTFFDEVFPEYSAKFLGEFTRCEYMPRLYSHPREYRKILLANYLCIGFVPGGNFVSNGKIRRRCSRKEPFKGAQEAQRWPQWTSWAGALALPLASFCRKAQSTRTAKFDPRTPSRDCSRKCTRECTHRVARGGTEEGAILFHFAVLRTPFSRSKMSLFYVKTCTPLKGTPWGTAWCTRRRPRKCPRKLRNSV